MDNLAPGQFGTRTIWHQTKFELVGVIVGPGYSSSGYILWCSQRQALHLRIGYCCLKVLGTSQKWSNENTQMLCSHDMSWYVTKWGYYVTNKQTDRPFKEVRIKRDLSDTGPKLTSMMKNVKNWHTWCARWCNDFNLDNNLKERSMWKGVSRYPKMCLN